MIVAVEKGLYTLKNYLARCGFDTVCYGEYPYPVDAIVYRGITASLLENCHPSGGSGIFFVDSRGKTPFQIAKILSDRLYTPLF